jgi:hypothetical protein
MAICSWNFSIYPSPIRRTSRLSADVTKSPARRGGQAMARRPAASIPRLRDERRTRAGIENTSFAWVNPGEALVATVPSPARGMATLARNPSIYPGQIRE